MGVAEKNGVQLEKNASSSSKKEQLPPKGSTNCDNEKSSLIQYEDNSEQRLYTAALVVSWFSILFSLGTGVAGIVLSITGKSEALFAYGLDAILDSFSSVAVVWRFCGDVTCIHSIARERKACIAIGALFLVSAISLIVKSLHAILTETHETKEIVLYESFACTCGAISVVIAVAKIYVGLKIGSQALYTDSIITLVGAASCFAGVAGLELYVQNTDLWYLDSLFGMFCGVFLMGFGIRLLYVMLRQKPGTETT